MSQPKTSLEKTYENRLRRAAKRQRLELSKSRRRDPLAPDFDRWCVQDARGVVVSPVGRYTGNVYELTTAELELWLAANADERLNWS